MLGRLDRGKQHVRPRDPIENSPFSILRSSANDRNFKGHHETALAPAEAGEGRNEKVSEWLFEISEVRG